MFYRGPLINSILNLFELPSLKVFGKFLVKFLPFLKIL